MCFTLRCRILSYTHKLLIYKYLVSTNNTIDSNVVTMYSCKNISVYVVLIS